MGLYLLTYDPEDEGGSLLVVLNYYSNGTYNIDVLYLNGMRFRKRYLPLNHP